MKLKVLLAGLSHVVGENGGSTGRQLAERSTVSGKQMGGGGAHSNKRK